MGADNIKPNRERRKLDKAARKRRDRAEYMRKYRRKPTPETVGNTPAEPEVAQQPQNTATEANAATPPPPSPDAQRIELLKEAIAGTVEMLTDTYQAMKLGPQFPRFGHERSQTLGTLWAPVLAPYIGPDMDAWMRPLTAMGITASAFYSWHTEIQRYRDEHPAAPIIVEAEPLQ